MDIKYSCLGEIVNVHGIKGQLKARVFTEKPEALLRYKHIFLGQDYWPCTIASLRVISNDLVMITIAEIQDRNKAESLIQSKIFYPRHLLPHLGEEEYYYDDLVDLQVFSQDGTCIGTITAVHDHGGGVFLDILVEGKSKIATLPFNHMAILKVDLEAHQLVADPAFVLL